MDKNFFVEVEIDYGTCAEFPLGFTLPGDKREKYNFIWNNDVKDFVEAVVTDEDTVFIPMYEMTPFDCYLCYERAKRLLEFYEVHLDDYLINVRQWYENGFAMLELTKKVN